MPGFRNPFSRPAKATGPSMVSGTQYIRSRKNLRRTDSGGSGGIVGPGRVLSKEEREQIRTERADFAATTVMDPEAQARKEEYEMSFAALKDKFVAAFAGMQPTLDRIGAAIDERWAPNAAANAFALVPDPRGRVNLRALILRIIVVLIVFGVLYQAFEYLLFVTRATACSVSTVFLPVTITVTANGSSVPASPDTTSTTQVSATSTSTHTITAYETMGAPTQATPYVYTVDPSGSTHWISGATPTATSLLYLTTYVTIEPTDAADGDTTVMPVESFTPPAYTTTDYSFAGPETTLTSTSTSTNTVTYTLSYANTAGTETRSAFPGISSAGWNSTASSDVSVAPTFTSSVAPSSSTYTTVYYTSSGPPTTSTTTTLITTTISRRLTVTLPASSSDVSPGGTESSASAVSGGTSPLSSLTTTRSGTAVSPESASLSSGIASLTILPIPTSLSTLLTTSGPYSPSETPTPISGSSMSSLSSSSSSGSSSLASAASISGASSSGVEITRTMSHMPSSESSSTTPASSSTSQSSSISSGMSPSSTQTKTKPSVSTTLSSVGSSGSPASGSSGAPNTRTQTSSSDSYGAPSLYTTLSILPTVTTASSAGPDSSSGVASGQASSESSIQSSGSSSPVEISTTKSSSTHTQTHGSPSSAVSPSSQSSITSPSAGTTLKTSSSSMSGSMTPSSSSTSTTTRVSSSSPAASSSSIILSTYSSSASRTESSSSFSNPFPASSPTATPTEGCGEHGSFLVDFDNLPSFTPSNSNDTDITQAPPIENPYYHLTWSDGYVYAPQPHEPYTPVSQPHLALFLADGTGKRVGGSQSGNFSKPGEIGDGPREAISAFWFDAYSAWFGCDNRGPEACTLIFSAFSWSDEEKTEVLTDKSTSSIPPCNKSSRCGLSLVQFPSSFQSLSGLQVRAFVGEEERMFFMDDLSMNWTNNTCAAGLLRQSSS